jgi:hypothetical protein
MRAPERAFELAIAVGELTPDDFQGIKDRTADDEEAVVTVIVEATDELIGSGEHYLESWTNIVHGENDYALYDARGFKADWTTWGRDGMAMCRAVGVPISRMGVFTGNV